MLRISSAVVLACVLVGCSGEAGDKGADGAAGAAGAAGTTGGAGPAGAPGADGKQGPSGVVKVLPIEGETVVPSLIVDTPVAPLKCQTAAHVASAGESAVISVDATFMPNAALASLLNVTVAVGTNGAALSAVSPKSSESMQDGVAFASATKTMPLVAGTSYVFGVILETSASTGAFSSSCMGTATIIKQ
jgi:hypothetical protein